MGQSAFFFLEVFFVVLIGSTILGLAMLVYRARGASANTMFALVAASIALWIVSAFLSELQIPKTTSLFLSRIAFASAATFATLIYRFSFTFPVTVLVGGTSRLLRAFISSWGFVVVTLIVATPYIIKDIKYTPWGFDIVYGPLDPLFSLFVLCVVVLVVLNLLRAYGRARGLQRKQLQFMLVGLFAFIIASSFINIVVRQIVGTDQYYRLGNYSAIFFVAFTSYAIIKHRLMDIRVLVLKSVAYSILLAVVAGAYVVGAFYLQSGYLSELGTGVVYVVTGLVLVLGFQPLKRLFEKYTDRIFSKMKYDPQALIRELGHTFASNVYLEPLTNEVLATLKATMKLRRAAFLIVDDAAVATVCKLGYKGVSKARWNAAVAIAEKARGAVVADELEEFSGERDYLRKMRAEVLLPIHDDDRLVSVLVLGEKTSGDMFTVEDIRLLEVMAPQAAVALKNASLIKEKETRIGQLNSLNELALAVGASLNLDEILDQAVDSVLKVTGAESGFIMLLDEENSELSVRAARGPGADKFSGESADLSRVLSVCPQESKPGPGQNLEFPKGLLRSNDLLSALAVPLQVKGRAIGALYLNRAESKKEFTREDLDLVNLFAAQAAEAIENARLHERSERQYMETIDSLSKAVDAKDHYTYGHSEAVTKYAYFIAKEMGLSKEEIRNVEIAARLHDIGKIGVPEHVLNKPASLTVEERAIINEHPKLAVRILRDARSLKDVTPLIHFHHERFDGNGYPAGISGEGIPLGARIIAVADSFNAMRTNRPYRNALSVTKATRELEENAGTQYDPEVVEAFIKVLRGQSEKLKVIG